MCRFEKGLGAWIVDNYGISGDSRTVGGRADGVRAIGDCHPRIELNLQIVGGEESANNDAIGVYCARDANTSIASRCVLLRNVINGAVAGFPPKATGVKCDKGACARIERNVISGCFSRIQDACGGWYCGCDGVTFLSACGLAHKPFASLGACASDDAGNDGG